MIEQQHYFVYVDKSLVCTLNHHNTNIDRVLNIVASQFQIMALCPHATSKFIKMGSSAPISLEDGATTSKEYVFSNLGLTYVGA